MHCQDKRDLIISDEKKLKQEWSPEGDLEVSNTILTKDTLIYSSQEQFRAAVAEEREITNALATKLKVYFFMTYNAGLYSLLAPG